MTNLPPDLLTRIDDLFADPANRRMVCASLEKLWNGGINVGPAQLSRAIVFLSNGDMSQFSELRSRFMGDPRDLLSHANSFLVNTDYWFSEPFSQMGPLKPKP